jgi:hypothetical protein
MLENRTLPCNTAERGDKDVNNDVDRYSDQDVSSVEAVDDSEGPRAELSIE